ncbi:MAG: shikimate dehydrogenase [Ferruginibacter sp.]
MKTYGIIGFPLTHSFSKKYFTEKFQREGITDARYEVYPIGAVNEIHRLIKEDPGLQGLNVTIPYKQTVLPHLDDLSNLPGGLSACNCIRIHNGKTFGYNTDVTGFELSVLPHLKEQHTAALVLGNGGAAEAVRSVLQKLQIPFTTVSRKRGDDASLTYSQVGPSIIEANKLIINTTPLGTYPGIHECPDIPYRYLTPEHLLYDLVYNPAKTLFLQKGESQGAAVKNGYEMLVLQAEESWKIWNTV